MYSNYICRNNIQNKPECLWFIVEMGSHKFDIWVLKNNPNKEMNIFLL
jgi:hypothetical protein